MNVYICSPFRGSTEENTELAKRMCRKAALEGHTVICPHLLYPQFLDDEDAEEREIGMKAGIIALEQADEIWVAEGKLSDGMLREVAIAKELGIPVKVIRREKEDEPTLPVSVVTEIFQRALDELQKEVMKSVTERSAE